MNEFTGAIQASVLIGASNAATDEYGTEMVSGLSSYIGIGFLTSKSIPEVLVRGELDVSNTQNR